MGRNVFQSDAPAAMIQAINAVVHDHMKPQQALELYETLRSRPAAGRVRTR
jgi:putative autoinducer-2 (AI-2) aldolase